MTPLPVTLDGGSGAAARLGLIVLAADETLEIEARLLLRDPGVALYHARIPSDPDVTLERLRRMEATLPETAARLPGPLDAVGYACTSGATVIGSDRVAALVRQAQPGVAVTDPLAAVIAALGALGARRIGMVTPYLPDVTAPLCAALAAAGIEVAAQASFARKEERTVARIAEAATRDALIAVAGQAPVDALFASCTNLRSFGVIDAVEAATGLPVVTSNQALLWRMLRLAGVAALPPGPGRLFTL